MRIQGDTNQFSPKKRVAHPTRLKGITSKTVIHILSNKISRAKPNLIEQFCAKETKIKPESILECIL